MFQQFPKDFRNICLSFNSGEKYFNTPILILSVKGCQMGFFGLFKKKEEFSFNNFDPNSLTPPAEPSFDHTNVELPTLPDFPTESIPSEFDLDSQSNNQTEHDWNNYLDEHEVSKPEVQMDSNFSIDLNPSVDSKVDFNKEVENSFVENETVTNTNEMVAEVPVQIEKIQENKINETPALPTVDELFEDLPDFSTEEIKSKLDEDFSETSMEKNYEFSEAEDFFVTKNSYSNILSHLKLLKEDLQKQSLQQTKIFSDNTKLSKLFKKASTTMNEMNDELVAIEIKLSR